MNNMTAQCEGYLESNLCELLTKQAMREKILLYTKNMYIQGVDKIMETLRN
jgi:hypothetical protein